MFTFGPSRASCISFAVFVIHCRQFVTSRFRNFPTFYLFALAGSDLQLKGAQRGVARAFTLAGTVASRTGVFTFAFMPLGVHQGPRTVYDTG